MNNSEYLSKLYRPPLENNNRDNFICMDKNEPPFSAFNTSDGLITDEIIGSLRTYPNPFKLYNKLSHFVNIPINQLLITHGSEQAIEFIFRTYIDINDEVVYLKPSFAMFDVFSYQTRAKVKYINFDKNMTVSVQNIINNITKKSKLFVLANPNNPTGTAFNIQELQEIAKHTEQTNTIFVIDEAYFHYFDINSISLINEYSHIFITRTFSKALGVAGARIGYAISSENNISLLRKLKPIDEINQLSNVIAINVLDNANEIIEKNVSQVKKWKFFFKNENINNIQYISTEGNFILLKSYVYEYHKKILLENHILPKYDFKEIYLKDCFRFSVRDDVIMQNVVNIFKKDEDI